MGRRFFVRAVIVAALLMGASFIGAAPSRAAGFIGYDVSWPNCSAVYPVGRTFGIVGVTGGHPFSVNACLRREWSAARGTGWPQLYMNIAAPNTTSVGMGASGPAGTCSLAAPLCRAYNYGWNAARSAYGYAVAAIGWSGAHTTWWLDVELSFRWSASTSVNARSIAGAIAYFHAVGRPVGVYSTGYQWARIVGSYRPGVPIWYATSNPTAAGALRHCSTANSFTGGPIRLVQYTPGGLDADALCGASASAPAPAAVSYARAVTLTAMCSGIHVRTSPSGGSIVERLPAGAHAVATGAVLGSQYVSDCYRHGTYRWWYRITALSGKTLRTPLYVPTAFWAQGG